MQASKQSVACRGAQVMARLAGASSDLTALRSGVRLQPHPLVPTAHASGSSPSGGIKPLDSTP